MPLSSARGLGRRVRWLEVASYLTHVEAPLAYYFLEPEEPGLDVPGPSCAQAARDEEPSIHARIFSYRPKSRMAAARPNDSTAPRVKS